MIAHTSSDAEDIESQAAETLHNLESLLRSAGLKDDLLAMDAVRVYLRRREDYPVVRSLIEERLGSGMHINPYRE